MYEDAIAEIGQIKTLILGLMIGVMLGRMVETTLRRLYELEKAEFERRATVASDAE